MNRFAYVYIWLLSMMSIIIRGLELCMAGTVQGSLPCRSNSRSNDVMSSIDGVTRKVASEAQAPSAEGGDDCSINHPSKVLEKKERQEKQPARNFVLLSVSILKWLMSLSGVQIKNAIEVIMEVVCFGNESDLSQISPKNRPSFQAILEQIMALCRWKTDENLLKTNTKPTNQKAGNAPPRRTGTESAAFDGSVNSAAVPLLKKELRNKVKEIFFFKYYPASEITKFEKWLLANPSESSSDEKIMNMANAWICNSPKDQMLWANRMDCRQTICELRRLIPHDAYSALMDIADIIVDDYFVTIKVKNEHSADRIAEAIGQRGVMGRTSRCLVE